MDDPDRLAALDSLVRKSKQGTWLRCSHSAEASGRAKLMFDTQKLARRAAADLIVLGYAVREYQCPHPAASHYHLTSKGMSGRARHRAERRLAARGYCTEGVSSMSVESRDFVSDPSPRILAAESRRRMRARLADGSLGTPGADAMRRRMAGEALTPTEERAAAEELADLERELRL